MPQSAPFPDTVRYQCLLFTLLRSTRRVHYRSAWTPFWFVAFFKPEQLLQFTHPVQSRQLILKVRACLNVAQFQTHPLQLTQAVHDVPTPVSMAAAKECL